MTAATVLVIALAAAMAGVGIVIFALALLKRDTRCGACGQSNSPQAAFCSRCGSALGNSNDRPKGG